MCPLFLSPFLVGAVYPAGVAGHVVLFLPDRQVVLHFVDDVAAGGEGLAAMAGADADPDREFADLERADPVHAERARDAELLDGNAHDAFALAYRELFVRFVFEPPHVSAFIVIAHPAFERREAARRRIGQFQAQRRAVDRLAREAKDAHPPATGGKKAALAPAARGVAQSRNSAFTATRSCSRPSLNG